MGLGSKRFGVQHLDIAEMWDSGWVGASILDSATDKSYAFAFPSPKWWCNQHATQRIKKSINVKYIQSHKYPKIFKKFKDEA